MADVLLIIAEKDFRDEELFETKEELEKKGISVSIASKTTGEKTGKLGGKARAEIALKDIDVNKYKAIIFVGGRGSQQYFNDSEALNLARTAYEKGKIVGAICIAPMILANSGILKGKEAAVSPSPEDIDSLKKKGALYKEKDVVVSGKIITACGPRASREFGAEIAKLIKKEK
jgi:protease I